MADYISREAAIAIFRAKSDMCVLMPAQPYFNRAADMIELLPAADAEAVRYGQWVTPHWMNCYYCCNCSACGGEAMHREYQWNKKGIYPICPNCGARMDGGRNR